MIFRFDSKANYQRGVLIYHATFFEFVLVFGPPVKVQFCLLHLLKSKEEEFVGKNSWDCQRQNPSIH